MARAWQKATGHPAGQLSSFPDSVAPREPQVSRPKRPRPHCMSGRHCLSIPGQFSWAHHASQDRAAELEGQRLRLVPSSSVPGNKCYLFFYFQVLYCYSRRFKFMCGDYERHQYKNTIYVIYSSVHLFLHPFIQSS